MPLTTACRILLRPSSSGLLRVMVRSNRPGRNMESQSVDEALVAPTTTTGFCVGWVERPSICWRRTALILVKLADSPT